MVRESAGEGHFPKTEGFERKLEGAMPPALMAAASGGWSSGLEGPGLPRGRGAVKESNAARPPPSGTLG